MSKFSLKEKKNDKEIMLAAINKWRRLAGCLFDLRFIFMSLLALLDLLCNISVSFGKKKKEKMKHKILSVCTIKNQVFNLHFKVIEIVSFFLAAISMAQSK